ncbi:MAG: FliH/SctL family protein [Pseudomonadota bacterium]
MSVLWTEAHSRDATRWNKPVFDAPLSKAPDAAQQQARNVALEAEAQARGFASGQSAGFAQGLRAAEGLVQQLRETLDALAKPLASVDAEVERVLVSLTLEAARRIAQQELNLDPAKVAAVVRDAVSSIGNGARNVAVFVHPDDYAALADVLADQTTSAEGWRLVADPEVLPGGCRVESEQASVVASLDARAAGLAHTLLAGQ